MRKQPHAKSAQYALRDRGRDIVVHKGHHLHCAGGAQVEDGKEQQSPRLPNRQVGVDDRTDDEGRH